APSAARYTRKGCGLHGALGELSPSVCNALSLEINVDPEVQAFVDEQVTLKCTFRSFSPITQKLTVDWTYQPLTGGRMETIFHYQSIAYPAVVGTFRDRISWVGNVAKGDASIAIQNPMMNDNGTFTCAVKNPPDVHHNIPQTKLTVTHRESCGTRSSVDNIRGSVFLCFQDRLTSWDSQYSSQTDQQRQESSCVLPLCRDCTAEHNSDVAFATLKFLGAPSASVQVWECYQSYSVTELYLVLVQSLFFD
uniref:Ig-like domain-containing protein n=1 Tax=Gopherus agassizii TaxID=38772 RepID=A0A452IKG2_9SAUR